MNPCGTMQASLMLLLTTASFVRAAQAAPAELVADFEVSTVYTSNVFLNTDKVQDFVVTPAVLLGVDFKDFWTFGYEGQLRAYVLNTNLVNHSHSLFLLVNPAWGDEGQNEFIARIALDTQRFLTAYSSINYLRPELDAGVVLEPVPWFRWSLIENLAYSWFYDDQTMDYLDLWSRMAFQFTMQSRTTVTWRISYGYRYYSRRVALVGDDQADHQIEVGVHFSQGMWKGAGLQLDYAYQHAFDVSGLILRNQDAASFSYLEETFMATGHSAVLGLKQIIGLAWTIAAGVDFSLREYSGWVALDSAGLSLGVDRLDHRLGTYLNFEYMFRPGEEAPDAVPEVRASLRYRYLRQWSNHRYYDTDQHVLSLGVELHW